MAHMFEVFLAVRLDYVRLIVVTQRRLMADQRLIDLMLQYLIDRAHAFGTLGMMRPGIMLDE
jgi:hypothetical protein